MNITRIPVTQEHIDRGKPGHAIDCPVAKAIQASGEWYLPPAVGTDHLVTKTQDADGIRWVQIWAFDQELLDWVASFDGGDAVHPFTLLLDRERGQAQLEREGPELPSNPAQGAAQG